MVGWLWIINWMAGRNFPSLGQLYMYQKVGSYSQCELELLTGQF